MTTPEIFWFEDNQSLTETLAERLASDLRQAIRQQGQATLLVSGGRSPVPLFANLSQAEIDWSNVTISLVDERWVDETDASSNAALVRQHLLVNRAAAASFIPLYTGAASPREGEQALAETMNRLRLPFTAVILGMGDDGHTASLFPASEQLKAGLALGLKREDTPPCLAQTGATSPTERMSFTLPWLLDAERIYLQFGGAGKAAVFERAMQAATDELPVSHVLHQSQTPVMVYASRA
ncbi:MAG: hypothetical protein RIQ52_1202 [Pseudomonadota bacterium]|jgi:6-phosphogluconolactonase